MKARQIHIMRACRTTKNRKDVFYLLNMVSLKPFGLTIFEQPLQAFVLKILYHPPIVL